MLILDNKIKKALLLGNEAVVRGALEAGLSFATTYPGTPASEIGDTIAKIQNSKFKIQNLYFEYSVTEMVALEAAAGAAFSGLPAMVSMKHYGLNVALDSLLPLAYLGCPLVVVFSDDPGSWSSIQAEQDSRWLARLGFLPLFEPADPQEAKEMTKFAFFLARKYKVPILIRLTTRVAHAKGEVEFGRLLPTKRSGKFVKNQKNFDVRSLAVIERRRKIIKKIEKIKKEIAEKTRFNFSIKGRGEIGLITSGVCFSYAQEINQEFGLNLPILKIGFSQPFPKEKAKIFIRNLKEVLIIEEIDPIIELEIIRIAKDVNPHLKIYGKNVLPQAGEMRSEYILKAIFKILKKKIPGDLIKHENEFAKIRAEKRLPRFCAGCPHLATLWAIKKSIGKDVVIGGDIGCYLMAALPPFKMSDYVVSMGAGVGLAHGISKVGGIKPVALIGDSTFFHAGIPALMNLVYNKSNVLVVILDNRTTAMTGHQPHPGVGITGMGEETKALKIEELVKACGVEQVAVINVYNLKESISKIKELYTLPGVSVIVAKGECRLLFVRNLARKGLPIPKFEIVKQSPDLEKLKDYNCPAIRKNKNGYYIDKRFCWGCSACYQIFPENIRPVK
jgi:indolepyruvate ferredoxin oxidoreductase alpha subunit